MVAGNALWGGSWNLGWVGWLYLGKRIQDDASLQLGKVERNDFCWIRAVGLNAHMDLGYVQGFQSVYMSISASIFYMWIYIYIYIFIFGHISLPFNVVEIMLFLTTLAHYSLTFSNFLMKLWWTELFKRFQGGILSLCTFPFLVRCFSWLCLRGQR